MKKLLQAIQSELDSQPPVGQLIKPARGSFRPYSWKVPPVGASGFFHNIALHKYTVPKQHLSPDLVPMIVDNAAKYTRLGFSHGSLQTALGNDLKLSRAEKVMLLPNHYELINTVRSAYRPALVARLLDYIALTNDLVVKSGEGQMLVQTPDGWSGFYRDRWVIAGVPSTREPFFPPVANVKLAGLIDHTPHSTEMLAQDAMRWLVQENKLTPAFELALRIAFTYRPATLRRMLNDYQKRT